MVHDDSSFDIKIFVDEDKNYESKLNIDLIKKAYEFAYHSHESQIRKSGEKFITHPVAVARLLAKIKMDSISLAAALLHDTVEDTNISSAEIRKTFGTEVADIIDGLTKLNLIKLSSQEETQAENIRKMILAMAKDLRVILIKLADRLHNMQTISFLPQKLQVEKAKETLEIYAPLAHRLGIFQYKWQLEDLSFQVLESLKYRQIQKMIAAKRGKREEYIGNIISTLNAAFGKAKINCELSGRAKHLYSIYNKMIKRNKEFNEIYDLIAIRVLVESISDCYAALGVVHSLWTPVPGRFKDYIATPKYNMYQSLHTTVIEDTGKPLEIQIRTHQMHNIAEFGVAAHWMYKDYSSKAIKRHNIDQMKWLKNIVELNKDLTDPKDFVESLKIDLFADEVFVFSPKGKIINLPNEATPIDFAYSIHTDVGNACIGAKVNNKIAPIEYKLNHGDMVEILTSKHAHPSRDWLKIVKTAKARNKIRQWFSKHTREDNINLGKEQLSKAIKKSKLSANQILINEKLVVVSKKYNFKSIEDLYAGIGSNAVSVMQVISKIAGLLPKELIDNEKLKELTMATSPKSVQKVGVRVKGVDNVLVKLARCCSPMPGDEITGFVTMGKGVMVHRKDCLNYANLMKMPERHVDVKWEDVQTGLFNVEIVVHALDRKRLLHDITQILSDYHINILSAKVGTLKDGTAVFKFGFEIGNNVHLNSIISTIKKIDSVLDAHRITPVLVSKLR